MNNDQSNKEQYSLRGAVFKEPVTKEGRAVLVAYIKLLAEQARNLPEEDRNAGKGWDYATNIVGVLAFQSADNGVDHDGWLNEENEPILCELLEVSGQLDVDSNKPGEWNRLFTLVDRL